MKWYQVPHLTQTIGGAVYTLLVITNVSLLFKYLLIETTNSSQSQEKLTSMSFSKQLTLR